jgi:hypothetical protein
MIPQNEGGRGYTQILAPPATRRSSPAATASMFISMRNPQMDQRRRCMPKKSTLRNLRVPVRFTFRRIASIRPEASAAPSSAVPLPVFSPQASAPSLVAFAPAQVLPPQEVRQASPERASRALPQQEEVCAVPDARSAQKFAGAAPELVESGSAQVDWLPDASVPDDYSAESPPGDCSVASAWADSAAWPDDSAEPELPWLAARWERVDLPVDS